MARIPQDIPLDVWIRQLMRDNKIYAFYKSNDWLELRDDVMRDAHYECQHCLMHGIYTKAYIVHHVNEVRKRPDLALSRTYIDRAGHEQKNLVPLCFTCHEAEHDRYETSRAAQEREKFTNEERW